MDSLMPALAEVHVQCLHGGAVHYKHISIQHECSDYGSSYNTSHCHVRSGVSVVTS
jgi:hypothetical protein